MRALASALALFAFCASAEAFDLSGARGLSRGPLLYRVLAATALDLDASLEDLLGLSAARCRFVDARSGATFEYRGLGGCLYKAFNASTETDALPGEIFASMRSRALPALEVPVAIGWRPKRLGWWTTAWAVAQEVLGLPSSRERLPLEDVIGTLELRFVGGLDPRALAGAAAGALTPGGVPIVRALVQARAAGEGSGAVTTAARAELFASGQARAFLSYELSTNASLFRSRANGFFRGEPNDVEGAWR